MRKYHPIIAILIGNIFIALFSNLLPNISLSEILAVLILVLGGFIATYLSKTNKAIIGLYNGIVYSLGCIIMIFISNSAFTINTLLIIVLVIPLSGLIGGFIAKKLRNHT